MDPVRLLVSGNPGPVCSDCCGLYRQLVFGRGLSALHDHHAPSAASDRGSLLLAHLDSNYHGVDWLLVLFKKRSRKRATEPRQTKSGQLESTAKRQLVRRS